MERDSFIFYRSFFEAIDEVDEGQQLIVYRAIAIYALNREEPKLDGIAKVLWRLIKPQLDANWKRYDNGCKGAEHGVKGGNPNFSKGKPNPYYNNEDNPKDNPNISPTITPNDNDNDNENENELSNDNIKENKKRTTSKVKHDDESLPDYVTPDFADIYREWMRYRHEIGKPFKSDTGRKRFYNLLVKLSGGDPEKARLIIQQSEANEYTGIFELKQDNNYGNTNSRPNHRPTPDDNIADAQKETIEYVQSVVKSAN